MDDQVGREQELREAMAAEDERQKDALAKQTAVMEKVANITAAIYCDEVGKVSVEDAPDALDRAVDKASIFTEKFYQIKLSRREPQLESDACQASSEENSTAG